MVWWRCMLTPWYSLTPPSTATCYWMKMDPTSTSWPEPRYTLYLYVSVQQMYKQTQLCSYSATHPDVFIHENEHGLSSPRQFMVCQSCFDTSSSCVSQKRKEAKTKRERAAGSWGQKSQTPLRWAQQSAGGVRSGITKVLIIKSGLHCVGTLPTERV